MKALVMFAGAFAGSFALFGARDVNATGWERVGPGRVRDRLVGFEQLSISRSGLGLDH